LIIGNRDFIGFSDGNGLRAEEMKEEAWKRHGKLRTIKSPLSGNLKI
jgi:hypothetical protein